MSKLYKITDVDGSAYHGGTGKWPLPEGDKPGAWWEVKGKIVPCRRGLHLCYAEGLVSWLGPAIFEAEYEGELIAVANDDGSDSSKVVVRKARLLRRIETWNERTARLFAADCAEHVLPIFERAYRNDYRPRKAIEAARAYAWGEIDARDLGAARIAAKDVVWAVEKTAAWEAARAAMRAAAESAAWTAAGVAASASAWAAAKAASGGAAWAAAESAAWDAARASAWAAAGEGAVRDEARATVWTAARDAERKWQTARLLQYLAPEVRSCGQ